MLPKSTIINKLLPKSRIFEHYKSEINSKRINSFDEDISRIYIANEISEASMQVIPGNIVKRIFILEVNLKIEDFDSFNISLLARFLNTNILFKLIYQDKAKLGIYEDKLYTSSFVNKDELEIELKGRNLDTIWENLVLSITGYELEEDKSLEEQLELEEKRAKLLKEIETLDKKGRREKQQNKKFEIHQEVQKLKKILEELD